MPLKTSKCEVLEDPRPEYVRLPGAHAPGVRTEILVRVQWYTRLVGPDDVRLASDRAEIVPPPPLCLCGTLEQLPQHPRLRLDRIFLEPFDLVQRTGW